MLRGGARISGRADFVARNWGKVGSAAGFSRRASAFQHTVGLLIVPGLRTRAPRVPVSRGVSERTELGREWLGGMAAGAGETPQGIR